MPDVLELMMAWAGAAASDACHQLLLGLWLFDDHFDDPVALADDALKVIFEVA